MHKRGLRSWVVPGAIAFATLIKLCLGVSSYSGKNRLCEGASYLANQVVGSRRVHTPDVR
jgi:alpha-1,3-glucosyltransferase